MPNIETESGLKCTCKYPNSYFTGGRDSQCPLHGYDAYVIRYAVFYRDPEWHDNAELRAVLIEERGPGEVWKLLGPMQGHLMKATLVEAEQHADAICKNNSKDKLKQLFGSCEPEDFKAFPIKCCPGHCDPMGCYHWEPADV
jgi:hypothetical protein